MPSWSSCSSVSLAYFDSSILSSSFSAGAFHFAVIISLRSGVYLNAGDLKTYLLSRRELVGMECKEAEDVSAASLTRMAMDVVEGLNYLHSKEYIHRDIACRNCLVAANRTIKIGDFGMTRRLYDQTPYVFTGRGE